MAKIKTVVNELRPNALWDAIKYLAYLIGGAVMSTGAIATFLVYFAGAWLNLIIIVGLFLLSAILILIAFISGKMSKDTT